MPKIKRKKGREILNKISCKFNNLVVCCGITSQNMELTKEHLMIYYNWITANMKIEPICFGRVAEHVQIAEDYLYKQLLKRQKKGYIRFTRKLIPILPNNNNPVIYILYI